MHLGSPLPLQPQSTHTPAASSQQIVYIFEPGAKVPRHKQETGSPGLCPTFRGFYLLQRSSSYLPFFWWLFCLLFKGIGLGGGVFSVTL